MILITNSNGMTIPIAIIIVTKLSVLSLALSVALSVVPVYTVGEVFVIIGVSIIAINHVNFWCGY